MPAIILSDNGVSSGSAGLKTSGSNDGILALQTTTAGGTATTAVTINASQNVGLGVSPGVKLDIGSGTLRIRNATGDSNGLQIYQDTSDTTRIYNFYSGPLTFGTNNTERVRIDASGNLGVGTTNPAGRKARIAGEFSVTNDSSNAYEIYFQSTSSYARIGPTYNAGGAFVPLTFWTSDTERARIDTSGNFFVNVTTLTNLENGTTNSGCIRSNGTVEVAKNSTSTLNVVEFYNPNGNIGKIQIAGSATTYATSSDYRLKKDVQPMTGALARVAALKPVTYKWKADGSDGEGFIAHELQTVVPDAVTGQKDETKIQEYEISPAVPATFDEEGNELTPAVEAVMGEREVPVYQGIDTSFLVATLTAAIQELKAEFDAYKLTHP